MGLTYCPNCKHKTDSEAMRCLYCGYQIKEDPYQKKMRTQSNRLLYITIFGIITVIIPTLILPYLHGIFQGIFLVVMFIIALLAVVQARKFINKKQKATWEARSAKPPLKSKDKLSMEEIYYHKGKTSQLLLQYNEALKWYNKSLELNPDFEPAKDAKEKVEKIKNEL